MTEQQNDTRSSDHSIDSFDMSPPSRLRRVFSWPRRHKYWTTIVLVLGAFIIIEFISLPGLGEIAALRRANPKTTALIEQRKSEAKGRKQRFTVRQQWVPLSRISEHLQRAVIVAEDGTFFEHEGIDWYEVKESIKKDVEQWRFARGGSTITQQVAKNLYLSTSKDPVRKLKEVIIAWELEKELPKSRILEVYLNIIEWGNGIFGVEAASQQFFGKAASDLSREEAARLAAVIPNPRRHAPDMETRFVNYRQQLILARMQARGW